MKINQVRHYCHRRAAVGHWVSLCVCSVVGWLIVYQLGILFLSCSQYSQTICWCGWDDNACLGVRNTSRIVAWSETAVILYSISSVTKNKAVWHLLVFTFFRPMCKGRMFSFSCNKAYWKEWHKDQMISNCLSLNVCKVFSNTDIQKWLQINLTLIINLLALFIYFSKLWWVSFKIAVAWRRFNKKWSAALMIKLRRCCYD